MRCPPPRDTCRGSSSWSWTWRMATRSTRPRRHHLTTAQWGWVGGNQPCTTFVHAARSYRDNRSHENLGWRNYGWLQGACGYSIVKQRLLPDYLVNAGSSADKSHCESDGIEDTEDTDTLVLFVGAVVWKTLCKGHHGQELYPETFQPPSQRLDWVLEVVSQTRSFCNMTPSIRKVCHSMDCTCHSTDCTSFTTDYQRLPVKRVLPDVDKLPDVGKKVLLAWRGTGIVGSEKTTGFYSSDVPVTRQEVPGLHTG